MSDEDQEQKTEQPTQKRLDEAYKKGNVPFSREIGNFLIIMMVALTVAWFSPDMLKKTASLLTPILSEAGTTPVDGTTVGLIFYKVIIGSAGIIAAPVIGVMVAAIAASVLQNGLVISSEPLMPQFSRISIFKGLGRMFSMRSVVEMLKSLLKIGVVGYACFVSVYPDMVHIRQLPNSTTSAMLLYLMLLAQRVTIAAALIMFFIALMDLAWQRFQFTKSLRMSKQEIRDEYKQSEGDPVIKQRLRRLRMERAKNRMMQNVPKADVVITNPTHFAVALKYEQGAMKAPVVLAKGMDLVALRIRELAKDNDIPVIENPPLARALFDSTEIDQEIPSTHYEAVAKIISYVYQLKGRKL